MRLPTQHRLLIAIALSRMVGFSHAENPEKAFARSLCPQNADLIALIGGCSMWATTTRDLELKKRGGRYEKTTYHIVCQGTISSYRTEMPFHHTSSVQLSPGGSVLVNNGSVLISARDAATSTNSHLLHRVNFMSDCRNFEGWTFELEDPEPAEKIAITMDNLISWVHNVPQVAPAISPLAEKDIRETEELLKTLPPSTGEGLTNWMVQVTYSDGKKWMPRMFIRTYPCRAVPPSVLRLLELMGGFQYEAKEILKEEPHSVKME